MQEHLVKSYDQNAQKAEQQAFSMNGSCSSSTTVVSESSWIKHCQDEEWFAGKDELCAHGRLEAAGDFRATPIYEPDQMSSLADLHVYR